MATATILDVDVDHSPSSIGQDGGAIRGFCRFGVCFLDETQGNRLYEFLSLIPAQATTIYCTFKVMGMLMILDVISRAEESLR